MALLQIRRMPTRLRNSTKPESRPKPQIAPRTFDTRRHALRLVCRDYLKQLRATIARVGGIWKSELYNDFVWASIIWEFIAPRVSGDATKNHGTLSRRRKLVVYSGRFVCWEFDVLSKRTESSGTCSRTGARKSWESLGERLTARLTWLVRTTFSLTWRYCRRVWQNFCALHIAGNSNSIFNLYQNYINN